MWVSTDLVSVAGDDDEDRRDLKWRNIGIGGCCTNDIHCQNRIQLRRYTCFEPNNKINSEEGGSESGTKSAKERLAFYKR